MKSRAFQKIRQKVLESGETTETVTHRGRQLRMPFRKLVVVIQMRHMFTTLVILLIMESG